MSGPTGTRTTRALGIATLIGLAWFVLFGLFLSPDDAVQRKGVRILYIHVPSAWLACWRLAATVSGLAVCTALFWGLVVRRLPSLRVRAAGPGLRVGRG